jgi:hypothetical protein
LLRSQRSYDVLQRSSLTVNPHHIHILIPEASQKIMLTKSQTSLKWPFPRVVIHRGGAPENTLTAIKATQRSSIAAVEFDVMLSADKIPMLMHDDLLTRTAIDPNFGGVAFSSLIAKEVCDVQCSVPLTSPTTPIPHINITHPLYVCI